MVFLKQYHKWLEGNLGDKRKFGVTIVESYGEQKT